MDIKSLQTDPGMEENGVTLSFADATVTLRSRNSEHYRKTMQRLFKPHESSMALGVLPDDVARSIMDEGIVQSLVVTWTGFTEDGNPVDYSTDKCREYVKVPVFRNWVNEQADKIDNYRVAKEAAETKN